MFNPEEVKKKWINGNRIFNNEIYCGPINNMEIIDYKDFWYDPQDKFTNVFVKNDLNEDKYITLPLSKYNILKDNFEIYDVFEIERKKEEIHLIPMKILILSKFFYDKNKENYVRRRSIQISKNTTLQEFTNKIIRVMDYFFNNNIKEEEKIDFSNINLTIYTTNKKLEKFDILTIIFCYNEKISIKENELNNEKKINNEKKSNEENELRYDIIIPSLKINIINSNEDFSSFLSNYNIKQTEIIIEINPKNIKNTFFDNTIRKSM